MWSISGVHFPLFALVDFAETQNPDLVLFRLSLGSFGRHRFLVHLDFSSPVSLLAGPSARISEMVDPIPPGHRFRLPIEFSDIL